MQFNIALVITALIIIGYSSSFVQGLYHQHCQIRPAPTVPISPKLLQGFSTTFTPHHKSKNVLHERILSSTIDKIEKRRSLISSASSSMLGFILGDLIAQIASSSAPIAWLRTLRMGSFGFWVHAPMSRLFYRSLEKDLPDRSPSTLIKKIFSEQIIYAPAFSFSLIFLMGSLAGDTPRMIVQTLKSKFLILAASQWILWPIAHFANYFLVPVKFKQNFLNVFQLFSNIIVSKIIH